jgi:hypothetical protein
MSFVLPHPSIPPCPDCGGQRVSAPCFEGALGRGASGSFHVSRLRALACTACGHVTLYVEDMQALQKALRKHPDGFTY